MDYDQLLEYLSAFGWFNLVIILLAGWAHAFMSYNNLVANFLAANEDHWCRVPELDHLPPEEQRRLAIPMDEATGKYETCRMYDIRHWPNGSSEDLPSWNDTAITGCQYGWNFEGLRSTIVTEWGLVCEHAWIVDLISPIFIAGLLAGCMINANITNKLGRRRSLLCFLTASAVCGVCAAMATHVTIYILCRTLLAMTSIGIISTGYVIVAELTPAKHREWAGIVYQAFYPLGSMMAGFLALGLPSWRNLQAVCALSAAPLIILIFWLVPESPRWLAFAGRKDKAAAVLSRLAQLNRSPIPAAVLQEYTLPGKHKKLGETESRPVVPQVGATAKDLFTNSTARLFFIILSYSWTTSVFMYCGVSYNLDGLFANTSVTTTICGSLDIVALLLAFVLLKFVGRRVPLILFTGVAFICATSVVLIQLLYGPHIAVGILSLVCRSCGFGAMYILMVVSVELFPTSIRNIAVSYASAICYAVTTAAPFIAGALTEYWLPTPNVVYGIMCFINLVLLLWLPETKGRPAPETIPAMEALRREMPRSQLKTSLVYVARSSIVDGIAATGAQVNPGELEVIDEVVKSYREESLNAMPRGPNVKPVFIVVPEGTGLAEVDHFVLQEVEDALQTGEGFDNMTYAKHRVYDLETFRALHRKESLRPDSIRLNSRAPSTRRRSLAPSVHGQSSILPSTCACGNPLSRLGHVGTSLAGSSLHPGTPCPGTPRSRASSGLSSALHHVLQERPSLIGRSISKVLAQGHDDFMENPIVEEKSPSTLSRTPNIDIPPSYSPPGYSQALHLSKALESQLDGAQQTGALHDMDENSPSLSETAIELSGCEGFDNIAYIPDEGDVPEADDALSCHSTISSPRQVPLGGQHVCHLAQDSLSHRGSPFVIHLNDGLVTSCLGTFVCPHGASALGTSLAVPAMVHETPVTLGDLGLLPTIQPLYQAIVDQLEVEDLENERYLTRL